MEDHGPQRVRVEGLGVRKDHKSTHCTVDIFLTLIRFHGEKRLRTPGLDDLEKNISPIDDAKILN